MLHPPQTFWLTIIRLVLPKLRTLAAIQSIGLMDFYLLAMLLWITSLSSLVCLCFGRVKIVAGIHALWFHKGRLYVAVPYSCLLLLNPCGELPRGLPRVLTSTVFAFGSVDELGLLTRIDLLLGSHYLANQGSWWTTDNSDSVWLEEIATASEMLAMWGIACHRIYPATYHLFWWQFSTIAFTTQSWVRLFPLVNDTQFHPCYEGI